MHKELGDPKLNATYYADVPLTAGCHPVFVVGHDAGGARVAYPTTTAFTIAVGGGTCAVEMAQPASDCDAGSGADGGAGGSGGTGGGGSGGPVAAAAAAGGGGGTGGGGDWRRRGSGGTGGSRRRRGRQSRRHARLERAAARWRSPTTTRGRGAHRRRALRARAGRLRHSPANVAARSVSGGRT